MTTLKKIPILGIDFTKITNHELLELLKKDLTAKNTRFIVTANPEIVLYARKHPAYAKVIRQADYITADGIGIIIGSRILKHPLPERVTGFDTLNQLLALAEKLQKSVYFLGAKVDVLQAALKAVKKNYPQLIIAGAQDGYFGQELLVAKAIQKVKPDIVLVALGFPKQELFIQKYYQSSQAIWMGVGGSFDVLAGKVKRAPFFWQKHHIEWLYRLIQEPTRLPRMIALPKYLLFVLAKKFHLIK